MNNYDPLLTMAALNMAIVSLHRITSTQDRVILDQEYKNIINNLRMGEINADPELTGLYQEIVRVINGGRLRDDVRKSIEETYSQEKQKGIKNIISENVLSSFDANPLTWLGNLAMSCASEYFGSKKQKNRNDDNDEQLKLKSQELGEYDELQRKLLASSWALLRKYELSDNYRLTQNALDKFYSATQENDPSKRFRMLKYLENDFSMYSPYWFYRAISANEAKDKTEAEKSFLKFNEVWRPVLRKDPYKIEALKFQIEKFMGEGLNAENSSKIFECLSEMRENTELEDWANNIYEGTLYFTLGEKEKAIECVMCNVDFNFETENSNALLKKFEKETPAKKFSKIFNKITKKEKTVEEVKKSEQLVEIPEVSQPEPQEEKIELEVPKPSHEEEVKTQAENKINEAEAMFQLALKYEERGYNRVKNLMISVITALMFFIFWTYYFWSASWWKNILGLISGAFLSLCLLVVLVYILELYKLRNKLKARDVYKKAANLGSAEAMYRLGELEEDDDAKVAWYEKAARQGHIEAQKALGEIFRRKLNGDYKSYVWYYVAGLCGDVEAEVKAKEREQWLVKAKEREQWLNGLNEDEDEDEIERAKAEARKIFEEIQKNREQKK
ncbi:MAG: hypothetical protein SPL10_06660 [Synergistales bacterium]|nr:hypothetical protein [Synergistales bacterium]MDY6401899.1 hypothetical protein [Synergistales bacterium]MDY6403913.1 hypothetical protein [Synergistales bacterium]MDY6411289.1 hypothetical protein [Synergistales bacterium]MDY6414821.1 hypothetical protein [Synergistales bacterium]